MPTTSCASQLFAEFYAAGEFYLEFGQVEDDEVVELLSTTPGAEGTLGA